MGNTAAVDGAALAKSSKKAKPQANVLPPAKAKPKAKLNRKKQIEQLSMEVIDTDTENEEDDKENSAQQG